MNSSVDENYHATPLLIKLHGLLTAAPLAFKILLFLHQALDGFAPKYTTNCVTRCCALRSSEFNVGLWNSLPCQLASALTTHVVFKTHLKTHLSLAHCFAFKTHILLLTSFCKYYVRRDEQRLLEWRLIKFTWGEVA